MSAGPVMTPMVFISSALASAEKDISSPPSGRRCPARLFHGQIPVLKLNLAPGPAQEGGDGFRDRDGAMRAAGAADRDDDAPFSFLLIMRQEEKQ